MIITLIIYIFIIGHILFKAFCISKKTKSFNNSTNILLFQDSVNLTAMPFYLNQGKIHLFSFFINFLLISFISLSLLPDFFFHHITFCMESEESEFESDTSVKENVKNTLGNFVLTEEQLKNIFQINSNTQHVFIYNDDNRTDEYINFLNQNTAIDSSLYVFENEINRLFLNLESFSFPAIKQINFFHYNSYDLLLKFKEDLSLICESVFRFSETLNDYEFEPDVTNVDAYIERLNFLQDKNSILISKLYIAHNKIIMPYLKIFEITDFKISLLSKNCILPEKSDIPDNIKSFIFPSDFNDNILNLNEDILITVLFLQDLFQKAENQIIYLKNIKDQDNFNFEDCLQQNSEFKNLMIYEHKDNFVELNDKQLFPTQYYNQYKMFDSLFRIYEENPYEIYDQIKYDFNKTNIFLKNLYINEDQKEVRNSFLYDSEKEGNILFLKNFNFLHKNILEKGLIINYDKIPHLKHLTVGEEFKIDENPRPVKRLKIK